ncbi:hypothetical protein QBC46DRAFT_275638 [Diplogelasinospora grovesii]|uniref:Uncharacterized protein n=1 Tax=Diplogelasinospora grovesii TaxID=303347 RepID=A0AAN6MU33_9PEZI|nr:hypothetical protein QBC46DRAFT_275638 [Diplogelasinospora grovesii]
MDRSKPRPSDRTHPATSKPLSPTLIDYEIRALGGTTTAFDTMPEEVQKTKASIPTQDRIMELTLENERLRREIEYYKTLAKEALHPVMAFVQIHVRGLYSAVGKFNANSPTYNSKLKKQDIMVGWVRKRKE